MHPAPGNAASWSSLKGPLRNMLGLALLAGSGLYMYRILASNLDQLAHSNYSINVVEAVCLTLGILGTLVLASIYHVLAVRRLEPNSVPATRIGLAYALGQVLRYIPGKIVGVVFEVRFLAGKVRASTVTLALVVHTLYDYGWTLAFAGTVLLCSASRTLWPLALLPPLVIAIWWAHLHGWCERSLAFPGPIRRWLGTGQLQHLRKPPYATRATLTLVLGWLPMLLGIGVALSGNLGLPDALLLGVAYLLAALGSLLVVVVPSGLIVREALFVWLGSRYGFQPPMLLFLSLVLRAAMTFAEVLTVVVFLIADATRNRLSSHHRPAAD